MITKGEMSEVLSDIIVLFEKQVTCMDRKGITTFLGELFSSNYENMPVIILGKDRKLMFKDVETKETWLITNESVQKLLASKAA